MLWRHSVSYIYVRYRLKRSLTTSPLIIYTLSLSLFSIYTFIYMYIMLHTAQHSFVFPLSWRGATFSCRHLFAAPLSSGRDVLLVPLISTSFFFYWWDAEFILRTFLFKFQKLLVPERINRPKVQWREFFFVLLLSFIRPSFKYIFRFFLYPVYIFHPVSFYTPRASSSSSLFRHFELLYYIALCCCTT